MKFGLLIPLNLVVALVLGIALVWMSIERVQIAYEQRTLATKKQELAILVDKLKTERNNLISPYNLRKLADTYNLRPARPGQLRHLELSKSPQDVR